MRVSTGRPGREVADAVAAPPATAIMAGNTNAATMTAVNRRTQLDKGIIVRTQFFVGRPMAMPNRDL
jgi:hypothetical protein